MKIRQQISRRASVTLLITFFIISATQAQQSQGPIEVRALPGSQVPPARPPRPPRPPHIDMKGNELQASAIKRVLPQYPPDLKIDQLSGVVIVGVTINKEGKVRWAGASTGHPMLRNAAVAALRGWEWEPTLIKDVAQEVEGKIRFDFDGNGIVSINTSADPEVVDPRVIYRAVLLKKLESDLEELHAAPSSALYEKVGEGYLGLSRIQEAIETYKEGISRFPREINLYMRWAGIYVKQGMIGAHGEQNQPEEALKVLELGAQITIEPDSPSDIREQFSGLLWGLGSAYLAIGRYLEAKETLERGLSLNPPEKLRGSLYLALGKTLVKLGDKESAITLSQKLLELGDRQSAMDLLGSLCHRLSGLGDKKSTMEVVHMMEKISQMPASKPKF